MRTRKAAPEAQTTTAPVMLQDEATDPNQVREMLLAIEQQLNSTFVQRQEAVRVILVSVLARQNYMLIGEPGTAKTSVIDCFTKHVRAPRFKILMGKFTQPEHVFGVLDINAFKAGKYETVTSGMYTDAPYPILDEALKASDGCMNSLLGVLGPEREYQGKRTQNRCTGGATNWPEVDGLSKHVEALYDRFLLRCVVTPVDRSNQAARRALYRASEQVPVYAPVVHVSVDELDLASQAVADVEISDKIIDLMDDLVSRLTAPKKLSSGQLGAPEMQVSDRRATQLQAILRANAWLEGRDEVSIEDFDLLRHGLWTKRKDVEAIIAILDTVDQQLVQELQRKIDQGRGAYRQLQGNGFSPAQVNKVVDQIVAIAKEVKDTLEQPLFTRKSRQQIKAAMQALHKDFTDLQVRAKKQTGTP